MQPGSGALATAMVAASFVVSVGAYFDLLSHDEADRVHTEVLFSWVPASWRFLADPLSITMCLFVTGVGALIHLFAYWLHARRSGRFSKFFLYMNLFALSMLVLVLGETCSSRSSAGRASGHARTCSSRSGTRQLGGDRRQQASEIINCIGDWGFMVAMFLAFQAQSR